MSDTATLPLPSDESGQRWNVLVTLIFVAGIASSLFVAGMSYGNVASTSKRLDDHIVFSEQNYVRKDARELAEIKGELRLLNERLDYIIKQQAHR